MQSPSEPLYTFPPAFLFGTATAATQVEGHCTTSDWFHFAREPLRVKHHDVPDVACDQWRRWEQDISLHKTLHARAHRMGIEWARIEPEPGRFDHSALDQYRAMIGALRDAGVRPMVTLQHFTLPQWLTVQGGATHPELARLMARMTRVAVEALHDVCDWWITINEPNALALVGYLVGWWPPGVRSLKQAILAHHQLLAAHVAAYHAVHAADRSGRAQVGVAHHLRHVVPADPSSTLDRIGVQLMQTGFNHPFASATCEGGLYGKVIDSMLARHTGFDPRDARNTQDFFGLNYYSRDRVSIRLRGAEVGLIDRPLIHGAELNDMGWEVHPEGLSALVREWAARSQKPVVITENGIADADDLQRPSFLVRHLAELARCIAEGVDVQGYLHWSLMDNFEWAEGYDPRFGLYAVNFRTQERTLRESGKLFAEIARTHSITSEMWHQHRTPPSRARRHRPHEGTRDTQRIAT